MSQNINRTPEQYERIWADMVERKSRAIRNRENYSRDIDEGEPVIYASAIREVTKAIDAMRWRQYQQQQQRKDNKYKSLYKYLD